MAGIVLQYPLSLFDALIGIYMSSSIWKTKNVISNCVSTRKGAWGGGGNPRSILFSAADINGDGRLDQEEFEDILTDPLVSWP